MSPRYPVYVLSYDRWQDSRRLTIKALEQIGVPYTVVVEPEEYDKYASVVSPDNIKIMPQSYHDDFEACVPHKKGERQGSGPVRNFIWDDAISRGFDRHWVMDDNIYEFFRNNENKYIKVADGTIFRVMEDFVDRYENVALAGPHYFMFVPHKKKHPPYRLNRRIYSCLLIKNDIPFRWRARYNDDTDLSLRVLKAGYVTVLFNIFTQRKAPTQTIRGGLTDQIYLKEGTLKKSQLLVHLHPDVTRLTRKFGRWHHHVDYSPFKNNRLFRKPGVIIPEGTDDYGLKVYEI